MVKNKVGGGSLIIKQKDTTALICPHPRKSDLMGIIRENLLHADRVISSKRSCSKAKKMKILGVDFKSFTSRILSRYELLGR